jgi:indole-3-glycerol phosphate synthase
MLAKADSLGLWSLVETHSAQEIEEAVAAGAKIIGVNNRDLDTLKVDLNTSVKLSAKIPDDLIFVVESGINGPKDIDYLKKNCARKPDAYLIGSSLMKAKDKTQAVKELVDA